MKKNTRMALFAILVVLSPSVFAEDPATILMVRDSSEFKDALAEEIGLLLADAGFGMEEKGSMRILKNEDFSGYAGIVVVNTGKAGRPGRRVRAFMDREAVLPPSVVVTTFGDPSKIGYAYPNRSGLDGLTSASLDASVEIRRAARDVVSRLGLQ